MNYLIKPIQSNIDIFLSSDPPLEKLYSEEVHLFLHCHLRGYDRTGEGIHMDNSYFDKYGAPIRIQDFWLEGYHDIEKMLADHFVAVDNPHIKFPPVAGYAGGAHLYKIGTDHNQSPWNWTGWIPRWKTFVVVDVTYPQGRLMNNRFFMAFRGNEIQNDLWDYLPSNADVEKYDKIDDQAAPRDKYRGGYFFQGNSWGRYLHIISIKSHEKDIATNYFKRYNYIVHPLAYRLSMNSLPDNTVDGIQWSILNIVNEPNFGDKNKWGDKCHALEIFNDFTYYYSYNPELQVSPVDVPGFKIPCHNGELMNASLEDSEKYVWWFDTYPLEYAEFLLETALSCGVYLHPLASNDAFYSRQSIASQKLGAAMAQTTSGDGSNSLVLMADPKGRIIKRGVERWKAIIADKIVFRRKSEQRKMSRQFGDHSLFNANQFFDKLPYKDDTAFGYTALIDPKCKLKEMIQSTRRPKNHSADLNAVEMEAIDYLIDGRHYAHLGVYGLFDYSSSECEKNFPILIQGQIDKSNPCHEITEDMELIFEFLRCKSTFSSSFTDSPKDFV